MLTEKSLLIGCGAGGNKSVLSVLDNCPELTNDDVVLINSTTRDIPADWKGETIILSPNDMGCGKERSVAKEMTLTAIQTGKLNLENKAENYDKAIVVTSLEGGTGSGSAPIIAKYCLHRLGLNTHIVGFKGFEEDPRGLQNTIEFFQELDPELTVQCINNAAFLRECSNDKFKAEYMANKELAKRIRLLNGYDLIASDQNIDSTDIMKVSNTVGYMTIEYEPIRTPIHDSMDFNKICNRMITYSKSLRSYNPGQQRMAVILNVSSANEGFIDTSFAAFKEAYGTSYENFMHKQYDGGEEYIAVISSGQKMPLDEVKAIYERYIKESNKVVKTNDDFMNEVIKLKGIPEDLGFNMKKSKTTKSLDDFMKSFQTKPNVAQVKEVTHPNNEKGGKK